MSKTLEFQELSIAIAADNVNPNVLNFELLRYSGIIPLEWELAKPPSYTDNLAQLTFPQGISIAAQPNRVIFSETIFAKEPQEVQIPSIASKYVEKLTNLHYVAVGINPNFHAFFSSPQESHKYLVEKLLGAGTWQQFGTQPMKAALQLAYSLERGQLNLIVTEALLRTSEQESLPVVVFSGNFNYELMGNTQQERQEDLLEIISNWQTNLDTYQELINDKFLAHLSEIQDPITINF